MYGKLCCPENRYKLEEALLEKDTALENLQKKVCSLQAEMRIIVKENMELSRQLATLNQLVIRPTCCYTCPGVTPSPPSTPLALSSRPYTNALLRDDVYYQCKCCFRSPFTDPLSPTETTCSKNTIIPSWTIKKYCGRNKILTYYCILLHIIC